MTAPGRDQIEALVRRALEARVGATGAGRESLPPAAPQAMGITPPGAAATPGAAASSAPPAEEAHSLVNVAMVEVASRDGKVIRVRPGAIVTPLARDEAEKRGVALVEVAASTGGARTATAPERPGSPRPPAAPRASSVAHNPRQIALGSDHGGFALKRELAGHLKTLGYAVLDVGTHGEDPVDYPDLAHQVARAVASGEAAKGIMVDGAGIGSAMAANKVPGIRCAQARDLFEIKNSREHNDANMLSLGGRILGVDLAKAMVALWLETPFAGGRHAGRVNKIIGLDQTYRRPEA